MFQGSCFMMHEVWKAEVYLNNWALIGSFY